MQHNTMYHKHRKATPNYPKCSDHADNYCELYCEKCNIPVCAICIISDKHEGHDTSDVLEKLLSKKLDFQQDLEELETRIYPQYEEIVSDVQTEKAELETNYEKLIIEAIQRGEVWQNEIATIVNQWKSDIWEMKNRHMTILNNHIDEITQIIAELRKMIQDLRAVLESNDVSLAATFKSRNNELRKLLPKIHVTLPRLSPQENNLEQLHEFFGTLSSLSIVREEYGYTVKTPEAVSYPSVKMLLDEPSLTATINTGHLYLRNVACLSDEEVWTSGTTEIMKLYNLQGTLLNSIQTETGNMPWDIAVTRVGDLVYTDPEQNTVNIVKNEQIQAMIRLQGWTPRYVCSTSSGGLLVFLFSDDDKQSKVVNYTGSTETQTIQFDNQGHPLYSFDYIKYISENRNLDICVADNKANAVVVVSQLGKLRFRYTGHPSSTEDSFIPFGISTDSQSHILTADCRNQRIHILDQDGQFLRYIHSCGLCNPCDLCVDIKDNLFVAELDTVKVKKIKYLSLQC